MGKIHFDPVLFVHIVDNEFMTNNLERSPK